jgi:hypothetical protein
MKKYCDYFFTTKRHLKGEISNTTAVYHYSWHIRNEKGEELQSSFANEDGEQYYDSREVAEQQAKEAIQDYYN